MLYVARIVHACDGDIMRNKVVVVEKGVVKDIYSFVGEVQSMLLVDEIFLSEFAGKWVLPDSMKKSHIYECGDLYAYTLDSENNPTMLK